MPLQFLSSSKKVISDSSRNVKLPVHRWFIRCHKNMVIMLIIYIPTNSVQGFPFLHILANDYYLGFFFFNGSHSDKYEVISLCGFNLWWLTMLDIFSCIYKPSVCLLWKKTIQIFCPFFYLVVCFFDIKLYELCNLDINPLLIICKYFLPLYRLSFHFFGCFLCFAKAFKFNLV